MALRYLQLPEAQYIPKYQQLDKSLLNTVDTQIESQIQQGKQQLDKYDAMVDTTMQSLATLPESQRLAFQEMANKTKAELDASVENQGYRNIQGSVRNLSRQFANETTPFLQRAEQIKSVNERLEKIGSRDARRFLQYQVALANENTPVNEKLELSSYIDVGDNWIDYADFAKTRKELLGTRGTTNISYDAQGRPVVNEMQLPNGIKAVMETRGRTADQTTSYLISEALSDSQMRAQLELEAKALGTNGNPVFAQMMDENGNFDPTKKVFVKFDKDGNIDETGQPLTGVEVMALSKFGGMGEAMADYSAQVKYESALNGNSDNIGLGGMITQVDIGGQNISSEKWFSDQIEKLKTINTNLDTERMVLSQTLGVNVIADGDNINVEVDGRFIPLSQYMSTLPAAEKGQAQNFIETHRAGRIQVQQIERSKENHLDRLKEQLSNNPETASFAETVEFNQSTGSFTLAGLSDVIENNPNLIDVDSFDKVSINRFPFSVSVNDIKENEVFETRLLTSPTGRDNPRDVGTGDIKTFIKRNGNFYDITKNSTIQKVYSVIDNENKAFANELSQRRDVAGVVFNSKDHKTLIQDFVSGGIRLQGSVSDINGKMVEGVFGMRPQAVTLIDGVPTIVGIAVDNENNPIDGGENARFTGTEATTIAYQMLGDNYFMLLGTNSLAQLLPQSTGTGLNNILLSSRDVSNLFGNDGKLAGQNIEIEQINVVNGGQKTLRYNVKLNGNRVNQSTFSSPSAIYAYLLELNTQQ